MKKTFVTIAMICAVLAGTIPLSAEGAVSGWKKGGSMISWGPSDFGQPWFHQSMANLKGTHADYVVLVIPYYQSTFGSSDVKAGPGTPTDEALISAINKAHTLGLKVALKPHLQVLESLNGWRAHINPSDRQAWFAAYGAMLKHLGGIGKAHNAELMVIGTELINMSSDNVHPENTPGWRKMIADLRAVFPGELTYSANWGESGWYSEKDNVRFWSDLDFIGLSAYYYLTNDSANYTPADLLAKWDFWNRTHIQPLAQKYGKPVVFTEVGYRSRFGTLQRPPRWEPGGTFDEEEQADAYEALFTYWNNQPFMQGVFFWEWQNHPSDGGSGDLSFTPQNKKAQEVMTRWFGGGAPGNVISFQGAGTPPEQMTAGRNATLSFNLSNLGSRVESDVLVEIRRDGVRVFQKLFDGQIFTERETKSYSFDWLPESGGRYVVSAGIFSRDWNQNYFWKDMYAADVRTSAEGGAEDVVIYAKDATVAKGSWSKAADGSAAGGVLLKEANDGTPKLNIALADPGHYFEATFKAKAGIPYHLWLRLKAEGDHFDNDSVHVQFSDSVSPTGTAKYRIGTTDSHFVSLEEGDGAGLQGWGWNDNHYGGLGEHIYFANDGDHTIRIQRRQDGVSIDQIVLSPATFLTSRPGATKNDLTIVTKPGDAPLPPPAEPEPVPAPPPPVEATSTPTSTEPVPAPPPPEPAPADPLPASVEIWWPTDGAWVGGTQPFKAMVQNRNVEDYDMFWQVDGDRLNPMYTSYADYPHKEIWVDLSGWNWRDNNMYLLNFVAKDKGGQIIGERGAVIGVWR